MTSRRLPAHLSAATQKRFRRGNKLTCPEARSSTERSPRPQVAVHHPGSNQLEEQVEGILELVI